MAMVQATGSNGAVVSAQSIHAIPNHQALFMLRSTITTAFHLAEGVMCTLAAEYNWTEAKDWLEYFVIPESSDGEYQSPFVDGSRSNQNYRYIVRALEQKLEFTARGSDMVQYMPPAVPTFARQ